MKRWRIFVAPQKWLSLDHVYQAFHHNLTIEIPPRRSPTPAKNGHFTTKDFPAAKILEKIASI
jgi:hypothetical protein